MVFTNLQGKVIGESGNEQKDPSTSGAKRIHSLVTIGIKNSISD